MKALFTFLLTAVLISTSFAQMVRFVEAEELEDYQTAIKIARDNNQMLFIALHDGSGEFRRMFDNEVFERPQVVSALSEFSAIAIDVRDEMGSRWVELFPVDDIPGFFFLNEEEFLVIKAEGYQSPDSLISKAQRALDLRHRYDSLLVPYNNQNLSHSQWSELLNLHGLNFNYAETASLAWEYLNNQSKADLFKKQILPVVIQYGVDLETPYPKFVINNRDSISRILPDFSYEDFYEKTYSYNLDLAILNEDSLLLKQIENELIPHDPDKEAEDGELILATYQLFAEETERFNFWAEGALKAAQLKNNDTAAATLLFKQGFEIADNYNTDNALEAANLLAEKSVSYLKNYKALMLQSYTSYLLENYEAAMAQVKQAMSISTNSGEAEKASDLMKMIEREQD